MSFEDDLEIMRAETTQHALEFISTNKKLLERLKMAQERNEGITHKAKWFQDQCEMYANYHNGNFGELFVAELDLVKWDEVINNVTS